MVKVLRWSSRFPEAEPGNGAPVGYTDDSHAAGACYSHDGRDSRDAGDIAVISADVSRPIAQILPRLLI